MRIQLDEPAPPYSFRFAADDGSPIKLLEIRITKVGETEPSWWLVHRDATLEEAVEIGILTAEEAQRVGAPIIRCLGDDLARLVASIGVEVAELKYGEVPIGFRQHGSLKGLEHNRLYELIAMGTSVGEIQFYG